MLLAGTKAFGHWTCKTPALTAKTIGTSVEETDDVIAANRTIEGHVV